jgi:hypothetical protein
VTPSETLILIWIGSTVVGHYLGKRKGQVGAGVIRW